MFARPSIERDLWLDYVDDACQSYRNHGVHGALDMDAPRSGADTLMFAACHPYPDQHHQTKLAWRERATFANHADPKQLSMCFSEHKELAKQIDDIAAVGAMR